MALGNFGSLEFIRLLILVFIALPVVSANVDCGGKAFHCVNTTHFKICVDLGGGVSKTIDSFIIPCPVSTECRKTNRYECEFPKPVILETVSATSVPDELSPVTAATTISADTSGSTPTEFLQSVTGIRDSSKTEYKTTTDISEVGKTKSITVPASNSEQGTTEHSQTIINTNTLINSELIEVPIVTTELYQTSNQTGLKNKTEISNNFTNIMNTSEFSQGITGFTTPGTTEILEIFSGTSRKKTKYSQVLDIQSEVTQEVVEISAPITTEIFQNLKDKIVLNETETLVVSKNTSVTNNIGYKQDPTEANESIITEMTKLSKQTSLTNESDFYQEPVFTSVPSTTETLKGSTYTSVMSESDFSQSYNGINKLITAEMFQTSTDGIRSNETELFESSTTSTILKKSDIFQGPDEISETITNETFQSSTVANVLNKTELFETLTDSRVLNTSDNYQGQDGISGHEMLQTSTKAPFKPEVLKNLTDSIILNISDMFQESNSIKSPFFTEISTNSTVANEAHETELFESSTTSRVLKKSDIFQGPDEISAIITTKTFQSSSVANEPYKTELFETSTDSGVLNTSENYYQVPDGISEHEMLQTSTNASKKPEVLETLTDSRILNISHMLQESDSINASLTTEISENSTVANELNKTELFESSTESTVSNKTVFLQGSDKTRALTTAKIFKTTTNASALNKTDLFKVSTDANVYETVTNQPVLLEAVLDTRSPITTKVSQTISDTNEHFVLQPNSSGSSTQSSKDTMGNDKNDIQLTKENSVSNKSVLHQGYLEITTPFKVNVLKTTIESNILNITDIFQAPAENNFFTTTKLLQAATNLTTFNTTESSQAAISRMDKNYTATFSPSSEAPLKVTHPSIVTREQGLENQIEWSNVNSIIDNTKENSSIIDSNNHTTLATEDSNSNNLLNHNIMTKVNNTFLVTKNVSAEYENSTETVRVMTVDANSNNFVQKNVSNGYNDLLMSLNKGSTSDATESDNLISSVSNPNDSGVMASSNRPIDSTMYDTTESYFNTLLSQNVATVTVSNKEGNGYTFAESDATESDNLISSVSNPNDSGVMASSNRPIDSTMYDTTESHFNTLLSQNVATVTVSNKEGNGYTFAVLTPPTVTIQDNSYYNTELQYFLSINTENSATSNNDFLFDRTIKTTALNDTNSEAINNEYNVSADEISTSSVNITNKEPVMVSDATDLPYKVLTPVIHNSVTTQDWPGVGLNSQLEMTTNAITSFELNSKDHVESNLNTPESYLNISKGLHEATVIDDLFSKNTSKINVRPETSENSTQMRNMHKEQIEYLSDVNTLPPTDSQLKNTDAATETSIFKAVESAVTIVKELTQPQNLSPAAKNEFKTTSNLVTNSFDLEQTGSINSIAETKADHKKYFVTESNIVESTTTDAATETSIFKAEESATRFIKELTQTQKLSPTRSSLVANDFGLEQTSSINSIAKTSVDYKKHFVTESNIVESKTTDTATETNTFKAVKLAASIGKDLTQPQKLSPTFSNLGANGLSLEQTSSIKSIAETSEDYKKHVVTKSNIVESKTTDATTDTSIFKAVESAATIGKDLTQPQKLSSTSSILEPNGLGLGQTSSINSIAETSEDYKKHVVTKSNIVESKTTDATTDTSIFKAVESAATVIKELAQPQKLSPTPSSLVANGFDLEQTGSINTSTETTLDYKEIVVKESNIVESTTYINYLDNTESNLGNGHFLTEITKKTTPSEAAEQISAALNIPKITFPPIHEQKILNSKDIDLLKQINVQHSPSETSIKEQSTQQRAMNTLDKQTKRVNQDVTTDYNLNINNTQFSVTSEPFFTVSDTQDGVIPIGTNSTKNDSIAHFLINHMDIPTSSNTYYSDAKTRNVDNDGSRISLESLENKLNESKSNVIQSTLNSLLNNTIREPTIDLINKVEGFKNTTDHQGLGANKAVTSEADLNINSTSLTVTGVSKDKASEISFKTYPSESTTKYRDFINITSHLNKDLSLQSKARVNGSKDTKKDNLSQTELKNYNEIAKSVILKNNTLRSNVRGSTYPHNTTYVSDIKTFETPNNKPYAVEVKAKDFINSNTYIKTNHTLNLNASTNERTQISNIPKAKTNDVLNKPLSLLLKVSKNVALPNKSVTERIQLSANGNYSNSEKDQPLAAHNEHINTTVRSINETEYSKKANRLPENKSEQKADKLLLTNDEYNDYQNKGRNLTVSRGLESASKLKSDHQSVIPSDINIKGSSLTPLIVGRQKVSTQINLKRPVITIPKYIGAAQATSIEKDIALVNQTQRTVLANVNNNFTSTIARKTTKITRAHATINNEKKGISFNCRNRNRGRYSDPDDCNKFYICIGKREPIIGKCPVNTVFSELKKQCTNNMSHCVRGSEFKCTAEGRFFDIFKQNVYYICLRSNQHFIRYKFQCQKGYYLNKTLVKCIEDSELEMQSQTSISNDNSKSEVSNNEDNKSNKEISKPRHSQKSGEEFECEEEGKFADGNDCRRYFVCKKNHKSEFRRRKKKCDSDELFHKDRKKCVDAESYEC